MPELPEVETIVRDLAPKVRGRRIVSVEVLNRRIARYSKADLEAVLPGCRILDVRRRGKFILFKLTDGWLTVHLGMTGQILFDVPPSPHTRAVFQLEDVAMLYVDIRMFGSIEWTADQGRTARLGPDAFSSAALPLEALNRKAPIKAILLNQGVFSGLGNIYTDEVLFRSGIHPRRLGNRLSTARKITLVGLIQELMQEAIHYRGSSVSDYVDAAGRKGSFQLRHQVYGREGLPCFRCGTAIRRIVVAQRGTHYCPKCQR